MIDPTRSDPTRSSHYATGPAGASALTPSSAVAPHVRRPLVAVLRVLLAAAAIIGIALEAGRSTGAARLFSDFSVQAGAAFAVCTLWSAYRAGSGRRPVSPGITRALLLYVLAAAVLHHTHLAPGPGNSSAAGTAAGQLLHTVVPLGAVLDWLLLTLPRQYRLRHTWQWLGYPFLYLVFAVVRGALITPGTADRSPWPFVDVTTHGYPAALTVAAIVLAALFVLAAVLLAIDQFRPAPPRPGYRISRSRIGPLK
ncbi:integral membrane regulator [Streptomyces sp. Ru73]|uniref:Pr6Pr family membrane protein n=1 Tax=Streptomyces sp. Ru73 TaxID=2080748 RepID=UPI000CDDE099|nr:Pr6Pr family membrane protein [Streptomyces sp. Ru73]POX41916.1 integral membrane regulator [Streptomyces sp. Ru73]